jgi:hypothetical protein
MTEQQRLRLQALVDGWTKAVVRLMLAQEQEKRAAAEFRAFERSLQTDEERK